MCRSKFVLIASLALACSGPSCALAQTVLLVTENNGSLTSGESARKSQFESWGYSVTTVWDGDSQTAYNAAFGTASVVYVSKEVSSGDVGYKLRSATIGVISEKATLDIEIGFSNSDGYEQNSTNQIIVTDNSHDISSSLASGFITIFTSTQPRILLQGTKATSLQQLATSSSGNLVLGYIESGGTLANSYAGNSTAAGRRVRLPWGGSAFNYASLDADGLSILQNALVWALEDSDSGTVPFYASTDNSSLIGGVSAQDEDIVEYDPTNTTGTMRFDGSVLFSGSVPDINAVHAYSNGVIIFSADASGTIAGVAFEDEDLVEYDPVAGTAKIRFDGSAIFASDEDIDAVFVMSNGRILLSTTDSAQIGALNFEGEDIVEYDPSSGTATLVFDGSTVFTGSAGVSAVYLLDDNHILISPSTTAQIGSLNFNDEDVVEYDPVAGTATLYFNGSTHYADDEDTDAFSLIAEPPALIGHWKLDESSGITAADSSVNARDGTIDGTATWVSGKYGNALDLNKVTKVTVNGLMGQPTNFTIACWAETRTSDSSGSQLVSVGDHFEILSHYTPYGSPVAAFHNGSTYIVVGASGGSRIGDGWHHYAVTFDDALNQLKIYIDGVLAGTTTTSSSVVFTGLGSNTIFGANGNGNNTFDHDGPIDDIRIYSNTLTAAEVAALFDLHGHWRLDENSGTTAADSSPQANDGTYTGGAILDEEGAYPGDVLDAVEFDGVDDQVDLPNMDVDFSYGFSVACWVKPSSAPGTGQGYAFFDLSNGQDADQIWLGWFNGIGLQLYMTDTDDGSTLRTIEDNTGFEVGKWVHCVATVDASGNATLYRNGQVTKTGFYTSIPSNILRTQASLATSSWNDNFPGTLDDVRFYNRRLTESEVTELYGLIGHWTFDEGSGTTISDSTLYAQDASFNTGSPAWIDGVYGKALEFDGTNDAITTATVDPPEQGAVAFWIRSDGPPASRQRPWGIKSNYEIWQDPDGLVSMDVSTDGYQGGFITTSPLHTEGRWYHLVAQYDSDDDSYEIYLNGELHKSGISTWAMVKQTANQLSFGTRTGSTQRFSGALDDFRLYNRHLSVGEINDLYGRIAYWKLDEPSGSLAIDSTEHGNDGTYIGIPALGVGGAFTAKTGTAVQLDGASEYIDTGKSLLNDLSAFSMLGWVRSDSLTATQSFFGQNNVLELGISESSGEVVLRSEAALDFVSVDNQLPPGKWTHVAVTGDGVDLKIYLNGIEVASEAMALAAYGTSSDSFKIGSGVFNSTGDYFAGRLDEVQVFDRALKPEEIFASYKGGRPAGIRILKWVEIR